MILEHFMLQYHYLRSKHTMMASFGINPALKFSLKREGASDGTWRPRMNDRPGYGVGRVKLKVRRRKAAICPRVTERDGQ